MQGDTQMKDEYWSIWGKIKSAARRSANVQDMYEDAGEAGGLFRHVIEERAAENENNIPDVTLPKRGVSVWLVGHDEICVGDTYRKIIRNDAHAVNTLRKLDTDDVYWSEARPTGTIYGQPYYSEEK